ncbi:MAG: DVUA0089 family protein [Chloroflexota bacterium]|nr:MAG: hypothetical protein DIU68_00575 [Chloroflexota bacterium]
MVRLLTVLLVVLWLSAPAGVRAQGKIFNGYLDENTPSMEYPFYLSAGDSVLLLTTATDGDLDTVLSLVDPSGKLVAENDDRRADTLDSALGYTATESGRYTAVVSRYPYSNTSGHFTLEITIGDLSILEMLEDFTRISLSGPVRIRDTEHFRIHYTLEGRDATTEAFVNALALSAEEIWRIQIDRMGWQPPPSDGSRGGDGRYDIYLADLYGSGESALGYTSPETLIGDNPETPNVFEKAATSFIVLENDFDVPSSETATYISLMRTTMSHEFNHAIQFGYDVDDLRWYYEATATWMETAALVKDEDATTYVESVFTFPEICFGTQANDGDGLIVYGEWLFIQALVDQYGDDVVIRLWENIAAYDGFDALEQTLAKYGDTIENIMASYHIQNLVRRYDLAPLFGETVWRENTIDDVGRWTYTGRGVQELAANYYDVSLAPGRYYAGLTNDNGLLDLWAVGVRGTEADAFQLGRGGTIDTSGYDHFYLVVFNPHYDDPSRGCKYYDYSIDIAHAKSEPVAVYRTWNAAHFEPLR